MQPFYYLFIDILTVLFPIFWSFEKKMYFFSKWKYAFRAIGISALVFILWDFAFTYLEVWGFNPKYIVGIYLFNLPIEELLFFLVVPFSCLFIYESVYFALAEKMKKGVFYQISLVAALFLFFAGAMNTDKLYTCVSCVGSSAILAYLVARKKQINHEVLWISYLIILIPFTLVNGILTGSITDEPIVWYNNAENMNIRFLTIPIEDFSYNLFLLLLNVTIYERSIGRLYTKTI